MAFRPPIARGLALLGCDRIGFQLTAEIFEIWTLKDLNFMHQTNDAQSVRSTKGTL